MVRDLKVKCSEYQSPKVSCWVHRFMTGQSPSPGFQLEHLNSISLHVLGTVAYLLFINVQGDHSGCSLDVVDIKTKVAC